MLTFRDLGKNQNRKLFTALNGVRLFDFFRNV